MKLKNHAKRVGWVGFIDPPSTDEGRLPKWWVKRPTHPTGGITCIGIIVAVATTMLAGTPVSAQDFPDALSRALGVHNDLSEIGDAVSRAVAVQNDLADADFMNDAVSRAVGIQNDLLTLFDITDAISRQLSTQNSFRCLGSFNDDGVVTMADVPPFINVLTGVIDDPFLQEAADLNCDGFADGEDIAPFVTELLNS